MSSEDTPRFIKETQRKLIKTLDEHKDPECVCELLSARVADLRSGTVPPEDLLVVIRISKPADACTRNTSVAITVARVKQLGRRKHLGERLSFVVVDDDVSTIDSIRLAFEQPETYDPAFYATQLHRSAERVLSTLGRTEQQIRSFLADLTDTNLIRYL